MHITSRVDYAVRALAVLADAQRRGEGRVTTEEVATAQRIPVRFLEGIMRDLRLAGLVTSRRGVAGGHRLDRPAAEVTVADVMRVVDGPLAEVRGLRPEQWEYPEPAAAVRQVWVATRASLRAVLEHVTLADVCGGQLPAVVRSWTADPDSWSAR